MSIKISFILPCYNVAPYIGRCLQSIQHQDLPQEEMEIVCIDDCSTDNTVEVIRHYQQRMPNIVLHLHEENKTSGGARNTGIDMAKGEYLWFVDPDDTVEPNVTRTLYKKAQFSECDILVFNINAIDENNNKHTELKSHDIENCYTGVDYIKKYCCSLGLYSIVAVYQSLYKREFCTEHNLKFPEIKASQDVIFVWRAIMESQRMSSIDLTCYNYIRRADSMTGQNGKLKSYAVFSQSVLFAYELQQMALEYYMIDGDVMNKVYQEIHNSLNNASRDVLLLSFGMRKKFYQEMCQNKYKIDCLWKYMNRKTKNIFRYKLPFTLWNLIITGYKLHK